MQAIFQDRYGSTDVLQLKDVPRPEPKDDEVLVRVRAAGVNALDGHVMRGSPTWARAMMGLRAPKATIRGVDVAGTVEAIGQGVQQFQVGDSVFGFCGGAFAEFATARSDHFAAKPEALTFEQAAAVPLAAITALQGLRDVGHVQAGQSVLVVGASGGVGSFAVQIAKAFGAQVTGVCSTRNLELVRSIGADEVIDYTQADFSRGDRRYDCIFQLAGTHSPSACRRVLTPQGTLVLSSGEGRIVLDRIIKAAVMDRLVGQRLAMLDTTMNYEDLVTVSDLIDAGKVRPVMDRSFALRDAPEAIRYLDAGHTQGKTVITV